MQPKDYAEVGLGRIRGNYSLGLNFPFAIFAKIPYTETRPEISLLPPAGWKEKSFLC